jgi:hypothetical protein
VWLTDGEQRRQVLLRIVRLEVGGLVGDQPVAEAVALVERVVGEAFDDVEQLLAQGAAVPGGARTPSSKLARSLAITSRLLLAQALRRLSAWASEYPANFWATRITDSW